MDVRLCVSPSFQYDDVELNIKRKNKNVKKNSIKPLDVFLFSLDVSLTCSLFDFLETIDGLVAQFFFNS